MMYTPTLPERWNNDLAYFFGLMLGDGSLPNAKSLRPNKEYQERYMVYFISGSKPFLEEIYIPLFWKLFHLRPHLVEIHKETGIVYNSRIESKRVYLFLKNKGYTIGRKAKIAKIPKLPKKYRVYLLAGLLDTDGGKKGSGFGLSTASKHFAKFCISTFKEFEIPHHSCPWFYNNHTYHQVYVGKKNMYKLLHHIPLRNLDKIEFINSYHAHVAQPGRAQKVA